MKSKGLPKQIGSGRDSSLAGGTLTSKHTSKPVKNPEKFSRRKKTEKPVSAPSGTIRERRKAMMDAIAGRYNDGVNEAVKSGGDWRDEKLKLGELGMYQLPDTLSTNPSRYKRNVEMLIEEQTRQAIEDAPKVELGEKFSKGRKLGTSGPIRKAIAELLAKNPAMKNPELWDEIKKSPPKGWSVEEPKHFRQLDPEIIGPNLETDHMKRGRFDTVCGQERRKVVGKITG